MLNQDIWDAIIKIFTGFSLAITLLKELRQYLERIHKLTYIPYPISSPMITDASKTVESDLRISYQGNEIDNLLVMQIRLKNTSNLAIRKSNIVEPITFMFPPDAILLSEPKVISSKPKKLQVNWLSPEANVAILDFELLNPKDELLLEFVWSGSKKAPEITARIEGITAINRGFFDSQFSQATSLILITSIGALVIGLFLQTQGGWLQHNQGGMENSFFSGATYGIIAAGILGIIFSQIREARKRMSEQNPLLESFPDDTELPRSPLRNLTNNLQATFSCLFWTSLLILAFLAFLVLPYITND